MIYELISLRSYTNALQIHLNFKKEFKNKPMVNCSSVSKKKKEKKSECYKAVLYVKVVADNKK